METVRELLAAKPRQGVVSAPPEACVRDATVLMNEHGIGSLLIVEGGRIVGMFTERDVLRRVVAECRSPDTTPVSAVMTPDVIRCDPDTDVEQVADLMRRQRVRHVPVVDADEEVVGLVSIGDVNALRFARSETTLHFMEEYVFRRS
jgi:CBS domain-containing protein